jgi:hypothetical protein
MSLATTPQPLAGQVLPLSSPGVIPAAKKGYAMADLQTFDLILLAGGTVAAALVTA